LIDTCIKDWKEEALLFKATEMMPCVKRPSGPDWGQR
ncbi:hypothetical protein DBR06_SOUSAS6110051, partial [Sousa chinensis]